MANNFVSIRWFDCYELACSLRSRMGLFQKAAEGEPRILPIRGPRKGTGEDDDDFVFYAAAVGKGKWPELTGMLNRIKRQGEAIGGVEFGNVFIELLSGGSALPWRAERGEYFTRYERSHMALRTNPAALMYSGLETLHMAEGWLNAVNVCALHSAVNLADTPRIHLVLDTRAKSVPVVKEDVADA
jgi:hypothetical protein